MSDLNERMSFAKIPKILDIPDLIDMQKRSYENFLQLNIAPEKREIQGLQVAFLDSFPITSSDDTLSLDFIKYTLDEPKCTVMEAISNDLTYTRALRATFRLINKDTTGNVRQISEQ